YGMLDTAKDLLHNTLNTLRSDIRDGVPVVVLEPSCASVFRDELINLLPNDTDAQRLHQQTFLLSEFLEKHASNVELPKLSVPALVHGHCHQKSLMKMDAEERVLKRLGVEFTEPDSGCCGMAGGFGFESDHYDVSMKIGERALLPAVRMAPSETLM